MEYKRFFDNISNRYRRDPLLHKIINFLVIFIAPFITTLIVVIIRKNGDGALNSSPFSLFPILIFLHAVFGGATSGIIAAIITTLAGNYYFVNNGEGIYFNQTELSRSIIFLVQNIIISIVAGTFIGNTRKLNLINKELSKSEEKLRDVIDSVFAIIVITTLDGTIEEANRAFLNIEPFRKKKPIGMNISETFPFAYDAQAKARLKKAIKEVSLEKSIKYDDIIKISDKQFLDVELNIAAIEETTEGMPDLVIVSAIDISERKLFKKELIKGREAFSKLIDSNIIGMTIGSKDGNLFEANQAFLDMAGLSEKEFNTTEIMLKDFVPGKYQGPNLITRQMLDEQGFYEPLTTELVRRDGVKVPIMICGVMIDEKRDECLRLFVNITTQKELENKKDEFLSIASHELKTPLTTLKGFTQILQQRLNKRHEENIRLTSKINNQINKLTDLMNELLDMSKIQSGKLTLKKETLNIVEIIKENISEVDPFLNNQKINFSTDADTIMIDVDKYRLTQVITNLLTNAIKFSPPETDINVKIEKDNDFVTVSVQDFGPGIPEDKIEKIFDKFYQAQNSENIEGLGLGLYISSEIISNHGGVLNLNTVEGEGSTFYFKLPLN